MIVFAAAIAGAVIGALTAKRRDGNRLDMAQYAAGYAISFGLCGLILTLVLSRFAG